MSNLNAFHTLCTNDKNKKDFAMRDFDILTMILSALHWKKNNGKIFLIADDDVIEYVKKKNLEKIWDDIRQVPSYNINRDMFWAGGKIFALKSLTSPIVMIDTDMIVWNDISPKLKNKVVSIHDEPIIPDIYKDKGYFKMKGDYKFSDDYDWNALPSNTAFLYIEDEEFKDFYCDESIRFMTYSQDVDDMLSYMVFAEQRLLSMCAKIKGVEIGHMIRYPSDIGNQDDFTHLWGYKKALVHDETERKRFCKRCVRRILREFPRQSLLFVNEDFFRKYI